MVKRTIRHATRDKPGLQFMDHPSEPPASARPPETCWVVTEGAAGTENQALAVAEAVGLPTVVKRVRPRRPWGVLPALLWPRPLGLASADSDPLVPPWPRLLITSGRRSVAFGLAIRRAAAGSCFAVHIQDPRVRPDRFDLVVAPRHDGLAGSNVLTSVGAPNRVTPERLALGARQFEGRLAHLPRPLLAVLLGGTSRNHRLTPARTSRLAAELRTLMQSTGAGIAVTPSRRTGEDNLAVLRRDLPGTGTFLWDGTGDNPYFGLLGLADAIAVTCDSASMVSEAATTGKPVHVIDLEGGSRRLARFHDALRADGITRPFDGRLEHWSYAPLNDTGMAADAICERLGLTGPGPGGGG